MEEEALSLLNLLCDDFAPYSFLPSDLYKGSLMGGFNVCYKESETGVRGMVTGVRNVEKYGLGKFPTNFEVKGARDGSRVDSGWSGEALLEVLEYLLELKNDQG